MCANVKDDLKIYFLRTTTTHKSKYRINFSYKMQFFSVILINFKKADLCETLQLITIARILFEKSVLYLDLWTVV